MQRARDQTEQTLARAGALDELLAAGALPDATVPGGRDDVQAQRRPDTGAGRGTSTAISATIPRSVPKGLLICRSAIVPTPRSR
jgi:hypothetical protein